jgi:uncharacterized protein (TIGR03000 family)
MPAAPGSELPPPTEKKGKSGTQETRANVLVELPADARLFVDGQAMKSTSARRSFITPPLEQGQAYYYDLRAEAVRDGQTVRISRRVVVRPGQSVNLSFPELEAGATATARAGSR